jgi:kinesin family protein 5
MRAKSIKNTARINAELSPLELKGLLKKAQTTNSSYQLYIAALEAEVAIWRSGASVEQSRWATPENSKAGAMPGASSAKKASTPAPSTPPSSTPRAATPSNPLLDNLRSEIIDSRPQTPTVVGLDKDERDEFLKRENELTDQLAEKVRAILDLFKCCDE